MTKQLSEKQKALLREGIQIGKQALARLDRMERLMDEIEQEVRGKAQ